MASTNKTANYNLSQFIGSDKPTYLGDYNADMLAIDTGMATNKTNADNAVSVANAANQTAGNAQTTATQAQQTANSANTLAQTAKTAADTAQAGVDANSEAISEFNLTQFTTISNTQMTASHGTLAASSKINIALSPNGTIGKIYGYIAISNPNYNGNVEIKMNTPIRPTSEMTINPIGLRVIYQSGINSVAYCSGTIDTNGQLTLLMYSSTSITSGDLILLPCLYWFKSFGDTPSVD